MNLSLIYTQLLPLLVARCQERRWWVCHWITLRPEQGAYGNLMMLLRNEDVVAFHLFTRLIPSHPPPSPPPSPPRDVKGHGGATHAKTTKEQHMVQRVARFYVPHNTISILVWMSVRPFETITAMRWSPTRRQMRSGRRSLQDTQANGTLTMH